MTNLEQRKGYLSYEAGNNGTISLEWSFLAAVLTESTGCRCTIWLVNIVDSLRVQVVRLQTKFGRIAEQICHKY